jgi:hypothetical protein
MPFFLSSRVRRAAGIATVAVFAFTGTASAEEGSGSTGDVVDTTTAVTTAASIRTCDHPLIENPFAGIGDLRDYVLAPGAAFEDSTMPGWTLTRGAQVVAGNEPYYFHGEGDQSSLGLPDKAQATSPTMCVDLNYPTMRFVGKQARKGDESLKIEVLYPEARDPKWTKVADLKAAAKDGWQVSRDVNIKPELGGTSVGGRDVVLRFTSSGDWQIDDVYVDPRRL